MEWRKKRKPPPPPPIVDGVIIKVYEEALPRPAARHSRPPDAPPSLGHDRKQLLLAYSRHLRRLHLPDSNSEPSWSKWKAAFLRSECQMNERKKQEEKPFRSRTQMWISGVVCRVRRRRREHNRNVVAPTAAAGDDEEPRSSSSSRAGAWGRLTARISWMCGCCYRQPPAGSFNF